MTGMGVYNSGGVKSGIHSKDGYLLKQMCISTVKGCALAAISIFIV